MAVLGNPAMANLTQKLWSSLEAGQRRVLLVTLALARIRGLSVYLVGGSVRDLLLGCSSLDLDLVVEGEALALAQAVAWRLGGHLVAHPSFGTATLRGPHFQLDLATARRERYPRPGALPQVEPATIEEDLARRDFTINAMALGLTGPHQGRLLDPFGGQRDLVARLLRALHEASFRDDATRILRAARYAARFSLRLEEGTDGWLRRDVAYLDTITGARLRHELMRILEEAQPEKALGLLQAWGALQHLHPSLRLAPPLMKAFHRLRRLRPSCPSTLAYLALLSSPLSREEAEALAARLALTRREREVVVTMPRAVATLPILEGARRPSQIVEALEPLPEPCLWALAALTPQPLAKRRVLRYLERWRHLRPALRPLQLEALGVPRGPRLQEALCVLRQARLDGRVRTMAGERRLIRSWLRGGEGHG